jgi:hypothetical protein
MYQHRGIFTNKRRLPALPLDQNYCTRAQYTIRDSPTFPWGYTVDVNNFAQDALGNDYGGPLCAFQENESSAKLAVAPCFLPKFAAGPYWIIAYDEAEGYALVSGGQPTIPGENGGCKTGTGTQQLWTVDLHRVLKNEMTM